MRSRTATLSVRNALLLNGSTPSLSTLVLQRGGLVVDVVLLFFWFSRILIAAGLLAHRLHLAELARRASTAHGGRWRWRWHVLVAAHEHVLLK